MSETNPVLSDDLKLTQKLTISEEHGDSGYKICTVKCAYGKKTTNVGRRDMGSLERFRGFLGIHNRDLSSILHRNGTLLPATVFPLDVL